MTSSPVYPWEAPLGAFPLAGGGSTSFRVWAPRAQEVVIEARGERHALEPEGHGVLHAELPVHAGHDYAYVVDGVRLPDPASRWQPDGLRGPSRVLDPGGFTWTDGDFAPPPLARTVLYEIHVGTFTAEGTFAAAIPHLAGLRELGVTTIELMPLAEFPGHHGWGYDGVYLNAPHSAYGTPARPRAPRRRRPRRGPRGRPRRRPQPPRRLGRAGDGGLRPLSDGQVHDAVGQGGEPRRRRLRPRPRVDPPVRRALDPRLPPRRPAPRRDPRADGLQPGAPRRRARPPRARDRRARDRDRRIGHERPQGDAGARPTAAGAATRPGPTTSTTRCASRSRARRTAGTRSSATSARSPRPSTARTSTTAPSPRSAATASARPRPTSRPSGSSSSRPTTTRSATAPTATACRSRRARSPPCSRVWHRSPPCSSRGRNTARSQRFRFFSDHIDPEIADGDPGGPAPRVRGVRGLR